MEKTLDELRAAIETDQADNAPEEDAGTQAEVESKEETLDASDEEGTSETASEADPTEGTVEEEKWVVPGRFRTHEDVVKAYQELESFTGRQSSEIQKLRTAIVEPPRKGEDDTEKAARLKKFADELAQDPEKALEERMRKVLNEGKGAEKAKEFAKTYEARKSDPNSDFAELEPVMVRITEQYGDMILANNMQNDPRLLDILHLAARGAQANEIAKKAKVAGAKKGEDAHRRKGKARLEGPAGTTKTKKLDISKLSSAEMKSLMEKGDIDISE
jgi:hypothetical protein